jgi:hypothetical protein
LIFLTYDRKECKDRAMQGHRQGEVGGDSFRWPIAFQRRNCRESLALADAGPSELIVIDLDPEAIGVLQVYLFDPIGPDLRGLGRLGPVAVFYMQFVEVFGKGFY